MANLSRLEGELKPQALRVLEMLRAAPERGVSNGDFIRSYIERFGGRICEMRKLGWQIETVREGQGKSRYFLRAEPTGVGAGAHMVTTHPRASADPGGLRMRRPANSDPPPGWEDPCAPAAGSLSQLPLDPWSEVA